MLKSKLKFLSNVSHASHKPGLGYTKVKDQYGVIATGKFWANLIGLYPYQLKQKYVQLTKTL